MSRMTDPIERLEEFIEDVRIGRIDLSDALGVVFPILRAAVGFIKPLDMPSLFPHRNTCGTFTQRKGIYAPCTCGYEDFLAAIETELGETDEK